MRLAEIVRLLRKLARLLAHPDYRHGLQHRIAATVEHEKVPFSHDFASVIDVGAHQGQFALFAAATFTSAHLYCVEPQDDARARLEAVIPRDRLTTIPHAVGERDRVALFHVTNRADSSSLRAPTEIARQAFAGAETSTTHPVDVRRLDDLFPGDTTPAPPVLLKIDIQGSEHEALLGATRLLANVQTVLVEVSFRELYAGQRLAGDIVHLLEQHSFAWCGVYSVSRDHLQRCLQADLLFERT